MEVISDINLTRWVIATVVMAFMLLGLWAIVKGRTGGGQNILLFKGGASNSNKRKMKLVETLYLDARSKLFLIEKDGEQATILVTPNHSIQVEFSALKNSDSNE